MSTDLNHHQPKHYRDGGELVGADGHTYVRRGTKAKRSVVDKLIASGAPLVLDMFSTGQLEWFEQNDATSKWAELRPYVTSSAPTSKQLAKHEMWNAGVWNNAAGRQLVYLTGSC